MKPVKTKTLLINRSGSKKVEDCWSRLNASRAARNPIAGRMFVTSALNNVRVFVLHTKSSTLAFVRNTDTEHLFITATSVNSFNAFKCCKMKHVYAKPMNESTLQVNFSGMIMLKNTSYRCNFLLPMTGGAPIKHVNWRHKYHYIQLEL